MKLFVTGINGFLGSAIRDRAFDRGHLVSGSARQARPPHVYPWKLGAPFEPSWLAGVDVLVHCAYDKNGSVEDNVEGTKIVALAGEQARTARQVFLSSYSARPNSGSDYGRIKYELETFFLERGHVVVRPGLVAGNGGLFGRNLRQILNSPVMPLLDGGKDLIPLVALNDFLDALAILIESGRPGSYNLFDPNLIPLRTLIRKVNRAGRHHALYVSIPCAWAELSLNLAKKLRIPIAVNAGNLRALKENQVPIHTSHLNDFLPRHSSLDAAIESAVAEFLAEKPRP